MAPWISTRRASFGCRRFRRGTYLFTNGRRLFELKILQSSEILQSRLQSHSSLPCASSDVLCLSLDWSNRCSPSSDASLVVSLSNGSLCLLRPAEGSASGLMVSNTWRSARLRAMDCGMGLLGPGHDILWCIPRPLLVPVRTIFTGGDDLKLKMWDTRQGFSQPVATNKRFRSRSNHHPEQSPRRTCFGCWELRQHGPNIRQAQVPRPNG
ncbi:hypothetical protein C8F01DRAFT_409551 [Mycena amicta]|nr:hypothetical protein C8F01DRAFT_409551 [Mycena amicta]